MVLLDLLVVTADAGHSSRTPWALQRAFPQLPWFLSGRL
jgi:hypothetical protein